MNARATVIANGDRGERPGESRTTAHRGTPSRPTAGGIGAVDPVRGVPGPDRRGPVSRAAAYLRLIRRRTARLTSTAGSPGRGSAPGSSWNSSRQPLPQNQYVVPSCSSLRSVVGRVDLHPADGIVLDGHVDDSSSKFGTPREYSARDARSAGRAPPAYDPSMDRSAAPGPARGARRRARPAPGRARARGSSRRAR